MQPEELRSVLGEVRDPEIGRTVGDLGMVGSLDVGRRGARVTIALPGPGYPKASAEVLRRCLVDACGNAGGPRDIEVAFEVMDEEAQAAVAARLAQGRDQRMRFGPTTRVLGIASGKGGVGKSSITVNLGITLARRGHSVGILDADVYGFSVPGMLGVSVPPMVIDRMVVPPLAHGVRCLSMGYFVSDDQPVIWRGPMLHKALEQFLTDAWWGEPDFVLVDMPPGTGDVTLTMAEYLPACEIVVVTTPQPAAQRVAQRSAYAARKLKLPLRGVVENMSWFTGVDGTRYELFGAGGGKVLADALGVPLLGQVPLVPALREGGDDGLPVTVSDPDGEASRAFDQLADVLVAMPRPRRYSPELTVRS